MTHASLDSSHTAESKSFAVIGAGISGLSAAWLLSQRHAVTLFEAESWLGGHTNTVEVQTAAGPIAVDTGFIVFNDRNYPNLVPLFAYLGVPSAPSDMSFSASLDDGAYEYSGSDLPGLLAQPGNVLKLRFWRMLADIRRFYARAQDYLARTDPGESIGALVAREGYSREFLDDHLWPMAGAIWSAGNADISQYPALALLRFFANHGLLSLNDRPRWRTVLGGGREYVRRLVDAMPNARIVRAGVARVHRTATGVVVRDANGHEANFDEVVIATHADDALGLLTAPTQEERDVLGAFGYSSNTAWLHEDDRFMPRRRRAWASWNYLGSANHTGDAPVSLTYWMNRLQPLATRHALFVTLNPAREPDPARVHYRTTYRHPRFDANALRAQQSMWSIQGKCRTWFCGAHFGYGFHEDGLQAGLAVAEAAGNVRRPWTTPSAPSRIATRPHTT